MRVFTPLQVIFLKYGSPKSLSMTDEKTSMAVRAILPRIGLTRTDVKYPTQIGQLPGTRVTKFPPWYDPPHF